MTPSQQTLDALYRQYHRQIHAYLCRMTGDAQEAEDLTQEVFLKAYRQLANRRGPENTRSWLFQVATYTCFDYFRRRSRRVRTELIPDDAQLPSAVDPFEQSQSAAAVVASLRRLAERHRAALILKDVHGFGHAEIAAAMGVSEGAAQILLYRARNEFRHAYTETLTGATTQCPFASRVAMDLVGRTLTSAQRRDLRKHTKTCPECRGRLAGRSVPAGALGFLLPRPPVPGCGAPPLPPSVIAPPALDIGVLHGVLSHLGAALASKAAVVAFTTAIAVGGQLTVQSVISPDTRAGGAATKMSQAMPTSTATMTVDTRGPRVDGARLADRPGAVRGQLIAEDWRTWQIQAGPQHQAPSAEEATARNRETSPERVRTAGPAQPQNGAGGSSAQNLEAGPAQTPAGNQYAGTSVFSGGGQSAGAGRESAPSETNGARGDISGDPSSTPSGDAGNALGVDPSSTPSGDAGNALGGDQLNGEPSQSGTGR